MASQPEQIPIMELCERADVTFQQVYDWCRAGALSPGQPGAKATDWRFGSNQAVVAHVLRELSDQGATPAILRVIVAQLDALPDLGDRVLWADAAGHLAPVGSDALGAGWVVDLPGAADFVRRDDG